MTASTWRTFGIHAAAGAARAVDVQGAHLETDRMRRLAVLRPAGDPQADLIRHGPCLQRAVQARHADQVDAEIVIGKAAHLQPLADDLAAEPGACDGVGSGIGDLALADPAVEIADRDLVGVGARLGSHALDADPVLAGLVKGHPVMSSTQSGVM